MELVEIISGSNRFFTFFFGYLQQFPPVFAFLI